MTEQLFTNETAEVVGEVLDILQENGYRPLGEYRNDPFFTSLLVANPQGQDQKLGDYILRLMVAERGKHLSLDGYIKAIATTLTTNLPDFARRVQEADFQGTVASIIIGIISDQSEDFFSSQGLQVLNNISTGQSVPEYGKVPLKNLEDFPNPKQTLQDLRLLTQNPTPWNLPQQWLMINPVRDQKSLAAALTSKKGFEEIKKDYARAKRFVANCRSIRDIQPIVDEDEQLLFDKRIDESLIGLLSTSGMFVYPTQTVLENLDGDYRKLLLDPPDPPDDDVVMQDLVSKLHPDAIVFLREHVPGIRIWAEDYMNEAEGNLQKRNEIGDAFSEAKGQLEGFNLDSKTKNLDVLLGSRFPDIDAASFILRDVQAFIQQIDDPDEFMWNYMRLPHSGTLEELVDENVIPADQPWHTFLIKTELDRIKSLLTDIQSFGVLLVDNNRPTLKQQLEERQRKLTEVLEELAHVGHYKARCETIDAELPEIEKRQGELFATFFHALPGFAESRDRTLENTNRGGIEGKFDGVNFPDGATNRRRVSISYIWDLMAQSGYEEGKNIDYATLVKLVCYHFAPVPPDATEEQYAKAVLHIVLGYVFHGMGSTTPYQQDLLSYCGINGPFATIGNAQTSHSGLVTSDWQPGRLSGLRNALPNRRMRNMEEESRYATTKALIDSMHKREEVAKDNPNLGSWVGVAREKLDLRNPDDFRKVITAYEVTREGLDRLTRDIKNREFLSELENINSDLARWSREVMNEMRKFVADYLDIFFTEGTISLVPERIYNNFYIPSDIDSIHREMQGRGIPVDVEDFIVKFLEDDKQRAGGSAPTPPTPVSPVPPLSPPASPPPSSSAPTPPSMPPVPSVPPAVPPPTAPNFFTEGELRGGEKREEIEKALNLLGIVTGDLDYSAGVTVTRDDQGVITIHAEIGSQLHETTFYYPPVSGHIESIVVDRDMVTVAGMLVVENWGKVQFPNIKSLLVEKPHIGVGWSRIQFSPESFIRISPLDKGVPAWGAFVYNRSEGAMSMRVTLRTDESLGEPLEGLLAGSIDVGKFRTCYLYPEGSLEIPLGVTTATYSTGDYSYSYKGIRIKDGEIYLVSDGDAEPKKIYPADDGASGGDAPPATPSPEPPAEPKPESPPVQPAVPPAPPAAPAPLAEQLDKAGDVTAEQINGVLSRLGINIVGSNYTIGVESGDVYILSFSPSFSYNAPPIVGRISELQINKAALDQAVESNVSVSVDTIFEGNIHPVTWNDSIQIPPTNHLTIGEGVRTIVYETPVELPTALHSVELQNVSSVAIHESNGQIVYLGVNFADRADAEFQIIKSSADPVLTSKLQEQHRRSGFDRVLIYNDQMDFEYDHFVPGPDLFVRAYVLTENGLFDVNKGNVGEGTYREERANVSPIADRIWPVVAEPPVKPAPPAPLPVEPPAAAVGLPKMENTSNEDPALDFLLSQGPLLNANNQPVVGIGDITWKLSRLGLVTPGKLGTEFWKEFFAIVEEQGLQLGTARWWFAYYVVHTSRYEKDEYVAKIPTVQLSLLARTLYETDWQGSDSSREAMRSVRHVLFAADPVYLAAFMDEDPERIFLDDQSWFSEKIAQNTIQIRANYWVKDYWMLVEERLSSRKIQLGSSWWWLIADALTSETTTRENADIAGITSEQLKEIAQFIYETTENISNLSRDQQMIRTRAERVLGVGEYEFLRDPQELLRKIIAEMFGNPLPEPDLPNIGNPAWFELEGKFRGLISQAEYDLGYALALAFRLLGLTSGTKADVRRQFKQLAGKFHPDISKDAKAEEVFKGLGNARDFLDKELKV